MSTAIQPNAAPDSSDKGVLDLLRRNGPLGIAELTAAFAVTPTAIRQRLTRIVAQGLVERVREPKSQRGRPSFRYRLSRKGEQTSGNNFGDLAIVLWEEIRGITDPNVKRGLLKRLAQAMADKYRSQVNGQNLTEKMGQIANLLSEREIPFVTEVAQIESSGATKNSLPVLTALACPYPELAEQDRGICTVEQMMFTELLGEKVILSECRLDGDRCCRFQTS